MFFDMITPTERSGHLQGRTFYNVHLLKSDKAIEFAAITLMPKNIKISYILTVYSAHRDIYLAPAKRIKIAYFL